MRDRICTSRSPSAVPKLAGAAAVAVALAMVGSPARAEPLSGAVTYRLQSALPAVSAASGRASLCFGNEPSWSLDLATPGEARFRMLGAEPVVYHGRETRSEPLRELIWRGAPTAGAGGTAGPGGDLVAFLAETDCSDGMSDTIHPLSVRVSLPDGRFLAGCCRVPTTPESTQSTARVAIEGVTWRLASLSGLDPALLGSSRRPVTALFEGGRVAGFSGCNQFTGSYTLDADRVVVGALVATRMACAQPAMSIETLFHEAFAGSLRATPAEGRLTLASEPGASSPATLVFEAERPPSVRGTSWEVTGYNNGREAVVSTVRGTTLTLAFGDGTVSGDSGCNRFHAAYEVDGDRLILKPVASTRRMCNGEGIMEQERLFLAALQGALTWTIRGDALDLFAPGGARALTARKASQ